MDKPLPAYRGDAPYVFVCYAHEDADVVYQEIRRLHGSGVNIWYDEGISPGHEWTQELADAIENSTQVLYFVSPSSVASRHCRNEVQYALEQEKALVTVYLEPTELPGGLKLSIGLAQAIMKHELSAEDYHSKISDSFRISNTPRERVWRPSVDEAQTTSAPAIVVLPFVNMSSDPEQEYFSDGLTEDIITDLSLIPGLLVVARNHTFTYKGKDVDARQVGRDIGVGYVLEGSVRKSRNQVRVTAQLIETASGRHLWAKKYDRSLEDVFALQDELTREIVTALDVELVSGERGLHQRSRFKNPEAGEALYRGMAQFYKFDKTSNAQARMYFEQFVRLQPDSILGYEWQAKLCQREVFLGWSEDRGSSLKNMGEFIEKALKIDDRDPLVLGDAAMHQCLLGNHDQSLTYAEKALAEAPGMDSPYYTLGWCQMFNDTPREGIENLKRSMRLSPFVTAPRAAILGTCYRNAGQLDLAIATLEDTVKRFPAFVSGRVALASCYALMGKEQEAKQEASEILRLDPTYTIARYSNPNLYRNKATMEKWAESLRKAGIPD